MVSSRKFFKEFGTKKVELEGSMASQRGIFLFRVEETLYTQKCISILGKGSGERKRGKERGVRERMIGGRERERKKKKKWGREVGQGRERVTGETGP